MKLLALITVAFLVSSCVSADNTKQIAIETLYPDSVDPPKFTGLSRTPPLLPARILTGALNAKFPPGTDLEKLVTYVTKLNGRCYQRELDQPLQCTIVEARSFCKELTIAITAKINILGKIDSIDASRFFGGC